MTISENKVLFSELAGCSFFSSTPNIHGGGGIPQPLEIRHLTDILTRRTLLTVR